MIQIKLRNNLPSLALVEVKDRQRESILLLCMTTSAGSDYNDNVKCLRKKKVIRMQCRLETALGGIKTQGCLKKFKMRRFPLRSGPLLTLTTVEEASFSYTFHKKNCAPFKPIFEYLTDRFRNALKNLKPGKGPSNASPSESL